MIVENNPSYGVDANGLSASYTLDFTNDLTHYLRLTATWQGDPVSAQTLYFDNYNGTSALRVINGSTSQIVPALSTGFVDIRNFDDCQIVADSASIVKMNVLTYVPKQGAGFASRGVAPTSLTNDPLFSYVKALLHFEGVNNSTIAFDSKTLASNTLPAPAVISTANFKYGMSALSIPSNTNASLVSETLSFTNQGTFTTEFFVNFSSMTAGDYLVCAYLNAGATGFENACGFTSDGTQITNVFVGHNNGAALVKDINFSLPTPIQFSTWNYFAYTTVNNLTSVFGNGNFLASGTQSVGIITPASYRIGGESIVNLKAVIGYIDEFRITDYPRYLSSAPVPTSQFLDQ